MLRFILRQRWRDQHSGAEGEAHHTLLLRCDELEAAITSGGRGDGGYDLTELVGVELVREAEKE